MEKGQESTGDSSLDQAIQQWLQYDKVRKNAVKRLNTNDLTCLVHVSRRWFNISLKKSSKAMNGNLQVWLTYLFMSLLRVKVNMNLHHFFKEPEVTQLDYST